jgi:hypothetical protein
MNKEISRGENNESGEKFNIPLLIKPYMIAADSVSGLSAILRRAPKTIIGCNTLIAASC